MIEEIIKDLKNKFPSMYNKNSRMYSFNDIVKMLKSYIPKTKETTFMLEGEEYDAFSLIYRLADKGVIHQLDHKNMEEEGVKVIL